MPRVSAVPRDDAIGVVEKYIEHFKHKPYPPYTSDVWKDMSKFLGGRWTAHNVYVNVKNNRRNIVTSACANQNIPFNDVPDQNHLNDTTLNSPSNNALALEVTEDAYDSETECAGLDTFKIHITNEQWKAMQEPPVKYGDRVYPILKRDVWTDVLSLAIFKQTQLPCAFVFKNSKIYTTPGSLHFVRIKGKCKSEKCGNPIFCYINKDPGDAAFDIALRTRDTIYNDHEDVKRPLRGVRRQEIGQAVFYEGCGNWQKQNVLNEINFGERMPMHIPNLEVLRQAKMDYVNNKLRVQPTDGQDIVNTIEKMKNMAPWHGFIHEVKRDKFYVAFGTPSQLHAYKQYCKAVKSNSTLSVDGTGSIVKPLIRYDGSQSGHIFLYSIVINFDRTTLSVYDLLTESQETDVFWWWLNHWQNLGAPKPKFAVCDSSRALMNGMSLSFNKQTIKTYIETCFLYALRNDEYYYRPPINTYIRLDVAHLMAMIRRWKCMKNMRHTVVRQFFLYCVALMCDCQKLEQFHNIFSLTCTVASHEFQDSIIKTIPNGTVNDARKKLESYIATRNFASDLDNDVIDGDEICYGDDKEDNDTTNRSRIKVWINEIRLSSKIIESQGTELNPFYFDDFIERFLPVLYEFPLWTKVAMPHEVPRGTSTFSEGHFNDLKNRILRNYPRPLRVDKFLKLEFEDNNGSATILASKLRNFNEAARPNHSFSPPLTEPLYTKNHKPPAGPIPQEIEIEDYNEPQLTNNKFNEATRQYNSPSPPLTEPFYTEDQESLANPNPEETEIQDNNKLEVKEEDRSKQSIDQRNTSRQKGIGKYFRPQTDIEHRNTRATNIKKSWLLQNGNCVQHSTLIDGKFYFAWNTCAWDAIVQILANSAMDDPKYLISIEASTNEILQFVRKFVKTGPSAALYKERVQVLKPLFESKIKANHNKSCLFSSYSIDLWDSAAGIWTACFRSQPSAFDQCQCPKCGTYISPITVLYVNHKIIGESGFKALQCALQLPNNPRTVSCGNQNCSEVCIAKRFYDSQIFIELDIRPDLSATKGLSCKVKDFPATLHFAGDQYRLAGIVARTPGHYMAYCRRGNGVWELCNDTNTKVIHASVTTWMEPHGVIYTRIIPTNQELSSGVTLNISSGQSPEKEYFATKVPLNDSDTTSYDNWRNKGSPEKISYDSHDENNNSRDFSEMFNIDNGIHTISIDGEDFQVLECYSLTEQ